MKLGLVSDTHVPTAIRRLPQALLDELERAHVDQILHAGDLTSTDVIVALQQIAPTVAVAGNMDPPEVNSAIPKQAIIEAAGWKIGLQHGHQRHALQHRYIGQGYDQPEMELFYQAMATQLPDAQIIVFGHFHVPVIKVWQGIVFINPGAVAPSYGRSTFAVLELEPHVAAMGDSGQHDRRIARRDSTNDASIPQGIRPRIVELPSFR